MSRFYFSVSMLCCLCTALLSCGGSSSTAVSTGTSAAPEGTSVPPAIAQAQVVKGGRAALDSLSAASRAQDGSFVLATGALTSCDGWAYDDTRQATPQDVWLELTQNETGRHYYWRAQRYSRPALAAAEKVPSVANAGFRCDAAGYQLPSGTYSAHVYQVDGKTSLMSDFSTYTPSPKITVK